MSPKGLLLLIKQILKNSDATEKPYFPKDQTVFVRRL